MKKETFLLFIWSGFASTYPWKSNAIRSNYHGSSLSIRGSNRNLVMATYPTTIRNVISKMTSATQVALQARKSRIEIDLPPGVDFALDLTRKREGKIPDDATPLKRIMRSNRDAARLVLEMFSSIATSTVALFPTSDEARAARDGWAPLFRGQVLCIDTPVVKGMGKSPRSRRVSAAEQEQALLSTNGIYVPEGTEVLVVVGPRAKDLRKIRAIHEKLGDATLIILLNARIDAILESQGEGGQEGGRGERDAGWVREVFESVFHYAPPALPSQAVGRVGNRELLLYHECGNSWFLAEKSKDGGQPAGGGIVGGIASMISGNTNDVFKTLLQLDVRPSSQQILDII